MDVKQVMIGVVVVFVAVFAVSPPTAEARLNIPSILTTTADINTIDPETTVFATSLLRGKAKSTVPSILASLGINNKEINCGGVACCDFGICTLSCPPQCRCLDVGEYCHAACEKCVCTKSIPPQCHCMDITNYSYAPCNKSE